MKTAVEWLVEKYNYVTWMSNRDEISAGLADEWRKDYLEQAKAMEKEQIIDTYKKAQVLMVMDSSIQAEQYYNQTFKSE